MKKLETKHKFTTLALLAATPGLVVASPQGGDVVAGAAVISTPTPQGTVIDQSSAKAIINWQSFSIGADEFVQFKQPDSSSVSLNRVVGVDPSIILGNLSSNGQVFLVNPNGVLFGAGATLDVGGLVASTSSINDDDFLNGNYIFTSAANATGNSVVNAGVIQARESGYVVLIGERVENSGSIETKFGQIALLAGGEVTLDIGGDGLLSYSIDSAAATELAGVENTGSLIADGGRVILAGKVSDALVATAVNNSGLIQANGIEERNGEIYLTGSGDVYNSGTISASGETGGTIVIHGTRVAQQGEVHADGSVGDGGDISITADEVIALTNGSVTTANAGTDGNGGDVIAYTEGSALLRDGALINAKGGSESGDGGFVEVSGIEHVEINGFVDASATNGEAGTFLIDPTNINIVSADDAMIVDLTDPGMGDPRLFENDGNTNNEILDTTIEMLLDGGTSVTLQTADTGAGDGGDAGNITVDAQIDKAAGGAATLTLQADNDIILNQDIVSTVGTLGVVLEADGDVTFNAGADITTNGGNVSITADADGGASNETITMASDSVINAGSGTIALNADGDIALGQLTTSNTVNVITGNGAITDANGTTNNITGSAVTLTADNGIGEKNAAVDALETAATSLDVSTTGTSDINIDQTGGVDLAGIDAADGSISISASGAVTTSADTIAIDGDVSITTSSDGNITLSNDVIATTSANGDDVSLTITAGGTGTLTQNAMTSITVDADGDDANATLNLAGGTIALNGSSTVETEDTTGGAIEEALLSITAGAGGLTTSGSLLANVVDDGDASITITSGGSSTIGNTVTTNVVDDGDVTISIDSTTTTTINAAVLAETGGASSSGDASVILDGDTAVDINNTVTAYADDDGNTSVAIGGTGTMSIDATVASTVDGNGNASIDIGSVGTEVTSVTIGASGSLALTEGSAGDSDAVSIYAAGAINTPGGSLNANDGITLSGGSISVAGLTASTGTVSVSADTDNIIVGAVDADDISINNTGATNGDITAGQLDADSGGITVNAAGALSTGANTITATGAIDLDGASVVTGNLDSSGSTVDVDASTTSVAVGTVDADSDVTIGAMTSINVGDITVSGSNDDVMLTAGTTLNLAAINAADRIFLSAGGLVSTGVNVYNANRVTLSGTGAGATYDIDTNTDDLRLAGGITNAIIDNTANNNPSTIMFSGSGYGVLDIDADENISVSGVLSATGAVDINSATGDITINDNISTTSTLALTGAVIDSSTVTLSGDIGLTITGDSINAAALNADTGVVTATANTNDVVTTSITANSISVTANDATNGAITTGVLTTDVGAISLTSTGDVMTGNASAATTVALDGANVTAGDVSGTTVTLDGASIDVGAITTSVGLSVLGADDFTAGGTIDNGGLGLTINTTTSIDTQAITNTAAVALTSLTIGTGNISGTTVTLDGETINTAAVTASSGLSILNAADFTAGGAIDNGGLGLTINTTTSIDTQAITNAASVALTSNTVSIGSLTATSGNVAVTANDGTAATGSITANSGSVNVSATNGATTIVGDVNAGTGITLLGAGVNASASGNLTTTTGNISVNVPASDANGIVLGNLSAIAGTVDVDADLGNATVGDVNAVSGTVSGEDVSVGSVVGNIGVMASNLTLDGTYTGGTFSATNTLTLDATGIINNSNVSLTGTNVNVDGTINAIATGAEQNASVTINATNDISMSGMVNVSSQSGNATFTAMADSDGMGGGGFTQTAGAVTVTAMNTSLVGMTTSESGLGNASINIAGENVQQLGRLDANTADGVFAIDFFGSYLPLGTVANQASISLTSTSGTVETNDISTNYSAGDFNGFITGSESVSINSAADVTVGGTIQTSNTASTESVSIMAAGNVAGTGSITSDMVTIDTMGDIGSVSDSLNIDANSVIISAASSNAWLGLDRATSILSLGSGIANTLDVTAAGNLNLSGTLSAADIVLDVAGNASDGGSVLTASSVSLNGSGNYGTVGSRFDINATDINLDEAVNSAVINSSAATTNLNFVNTGHGDIDVTGSSDLSVTGAAAIAANIFTTNISGSLDVQQDLSTTTPLVLTASGITSGTNVLAASSVTLNGTGSSNVDVDTDAATVVLGTGLTNVDIDNNANTAATVFNFGAGSYGAVTLTAGGDTSFAGNNITTSGDVSVTSAGALNANRSITVNTGANADLSLLATDALTQQVGTNLTATAGSNAGDSATITLSGSSVVQDGIVVANGGGAGGTNTIDVDSTSGNIEANILSVTASNGNDALIDINSAAAVTLDTNSSFGIGIIQAIANTGINATVNVTAGTTITQNANNLVIATASAASDINVNAGGAVQLNGSVDADNVAGTSTIDVTGSGYTGTAVLDANSVAITTTGGAINARTRSANITLAGTNTLTLDNTAFSGATTFNYSQTNYNTLDLSFGGNTSLVGGNITANAVSISSNGGLALNQDYTAPIINLTAGGQVTAGTLTTSTLNLAGNGGASFGTSDAKIMTNADLVDLGAGISNVFINNTRTGNATLNFSGTNYGIVDFNIAGTPSSPMVSASTLTVQGNDFLASALAISGNGNITVNNGFDVNGGTVPGVFGDTLLTAAVDSVRDIINDGGSSDPNASFIATDKLTLNVGNLKQSNQYLLLKADDIQLTGVSNAENLLVQLTPFSSGADMLGNYKSLSLNQTAASGTADFKYGFDEHFAPFTGTTIALGEQGFGGDISVGSINAGTKNLLLLSGGTISGLDNIIGTGLLGTADETGGFFVVRPIVTTITADQLGAFGFKFGARVSTIELNGGFDAAGEDSKSKDDLELENGGVNDGSEKQCS